MAVWTTARRSFFYIVQRRLLSNEIFSCQDGRLISINHPLAKLTLFLGDDDLLRVGGRLSNAAHPHNEKHPIILPRCVLTQRLVEHAHSITCHGGPQVIRSYLSRFCWIIGGGRLAQSVYRKWSLKYIESGVCASQLVTRAIQQQIAPLPAFSTTFTRPFAHMEIDFAGPFQIHFSKGRGAKSTKEYVAIFICMVINAAHIKIVFDLTTEAFLAAFARFTARRDLCTQNHSHNGTTFSGAAAELFCLFLAPSSNMKKIVCALAVSGVQWNFIPLERLTLVVCGKLP